MRAKSLLHPALVALLLAACRSTTPAPAVAPVSRSATPAASQTLRYTILMSGNKAGSEVTTRSGDRIVSDVEYSDRGRGPKIHSVITVDDRDHPIALEASGVDYFKQPLQERFAIESGRAHWSSGAETGEAAAGPFYAGFYAGDADMLVRAALRSGGVVPLLPAGSATVRKAGDATVRGTHVSAYEIGGFGFEPDEVWLDDDLNLFAAVSPWFTTIREGFESETQQLIDLQEQRARARAAELSKRLRHEPVAGRIVVTNARVFDPRNGSLSVPETVVVQGNRIASVGTNDVDRAGTSIDAHGQVLLPGLWDMHQHFSRVDGLLDIAFGVTSGRDLANDNDTLLALKQQWENGAAIGPRLVMAGIIDGPGPYHGPTKMLADNEADAKKIIDFYADHSYEGLKIYSSIRPELVPVITKYAHDKHLRVSGHVPAGMTARQAVEAGFDEIQHANMLFLNFMPDVTDTRTPARFTEVAKRGADLDLASPSVREFIDFLRAHGTVVDPTVGVFEGLFTARKGSPSPGLAGIIDRLPVRVRRSEAGGGLDVPQGMDEQYRASFAKMLDLVKLLHDSGVRIVAGTDSYAGFTLHRELELYAKAGIPPSDVLTIATLAPAQILGRERDLGTIEPGKLADFILVDGDPTQNISDIRRITHVVKDGRIYVPAEMFPELGIAP